MSMPRHTRKYGQSEARMVHFAPIAPPAGPAGAPPAGPDKSPQGLAAKLESLVVTNLDAAEAKDLPTTIATELKKLTAADQAKAEQTFTSKVESAATQEFTYELGEINKRTPPPSPADAAKEAAQKVVNDLNGMVSITLDATNTPTITVNIDAPANAPRSAPTNRGEELIQAMEDAQAEFEAAGKENPPNALKQFAAAMKGMGAAFSYIKGAFDGSNDKAPQSGPNAGPAGNPSSAPNKSAVRAKLRNEMKSKSKTAAALLADKDAELGADDTVPGKKKDLKDAADDVKVKEGDVQTSKSKIANLESQKAKFKDAATVDGIQRQIDAEQVILTAAETALKTAQDTKTALEKSVSELEAEIKELKEMQSGLDKSAKDVEGVMRKLGETVALFPNKFAQDLATTLKSIVIEGDPASLDLRIKAPAAAHMRSIKDNAAVLLHGTEVGAPVLTDEDIGFTAGGVLIPEKFEAFGKRIEAALQAKVEPRKAEIAKEKQEHMDKLLENIKNKKKMDGSPDALHEEFREGILKAAAKKNTWETLNSHEYIVLDDTIVMQNIDGSAAYTYQEAIGDLRGNTNRTFNTATKKFVDVPTKDDGSGNDVPDTDNYTYNTTTRTWNLK